MGIQHSETDRWILVLMLAVVALCYIAMYCAPTDYLNIEHEFQFLREVAVGS
jgi:hypothetical protein